MGMLPKAGSMQATSDSVPGTALHWPSKTDVLEVRRNAGCHS